MVRYSNILGISLWSLKIIRQRPTDGKLGTACAIVLLAFAVLFTLLGFIMFFYINGDVDMAAKATESTASLCQIFIKMSPLLFHRERMKQLIDSTQYFWNPEDYPEILPGIERTYKIAYYFQYVYRTMIFSTLIFFYIYSMVNLSALPVVNYVPPSLPYGYELILVGQYLVAFFIACCMTGFDNLYLAFTIHLVIQLRCINYSVKHIDIQSPQFHTNLKQCVEHHRFILRFASELVRLCSIPLLGQYIISVYLTCMEIYLLRESIGDPVRITLSKLYTMSLLIQFACYCFPASEFTYEAEALGDAVYQSEWYNGTISQQKNMRFILMRAQQEFSFSAAGLADINRAAFVSVFKASVSFFTFMRQFKEE